MKRRFAGAIGALMMPVMSVVAHGAEVVSAPTLTLDGARAVLAAAEAQAAKGSNTGAIAVVDPAGNVLAVHRLDGTFPAASDVAIGKARTAARFRKPTKFFEETIAKGRTAMVAMNDFTPLQGGVLIMADGQVVGAVGVSGAASAAQDEEVATAGAAAIRAPTTTSLGPVTPAMLADAGFVGPPAPGA